MSRLLVRLKKRIQKRKRKRIPKHLRERYILRTAQFNSTNDRTIFLKRMAWHSNEKRMNWTSNEQKKIWWWKYCRESITILHEHGDEQQTSTR